MTSIVDLFRRNPDFAKLFWARVISLLGDWFNSLALLALLRHMGVVDVSAYGWILTLKTLPGFFTSPLAGVMADRYSRREIMRAADLGRALVVGSLCLLYFYPSVMVLYILTALQSAIGSFFEPAKDALTPDLVSLQDLSLANTVNSAMWSITFAVGSALGGLMVAWIGWAPTLLIDMMTYVCSFLLVSSLQEPTRSQTGPSEHPSAWKDLREGFDWLGHQPRVLSLVLVKAGWSLGGVSVVLTALGERVYPIHGQPLLGVSLLFTARALGTGAGPLFTRWLVQGDSAAVERAIWAAFVVASVSYAGVSLCSTPWMAALLVAIAHMGGATLWIFSTLRLQQLTPRGVRGRVFAAEQAAFTLTMALSTWGFGQIIDQDLLPLSWVPVLTGLVVMIPAAMWAWRGRRLGWGDEVLARSTAELR